MRLWRSFVLLGNLTKSLHYKQEVGSGQLKESEGLIKEVSCWYPRFLELDTNNKKSGYLSICRFNFDHSFLL